MRSGPAFKYGYGVSAVNPSSGPYWVGKDDAAPPEPNPTISEIIETTSKLYSKSYAGQIDELNKAFGALGSSLLNAMNPIVQKMKEHFGNSILGNTTVESKEILDDWNPSKWGPFPESYKGEKILSILWEENVESFDQIITNGRKRKRDRHYLEVTVKTDSTVAVILLGPGGEFISILSEKAAD